MNDYDYNDYKAFMYKYDSGCVNLFMNGARARRSDRYTKDVDR